MNATPVTWVVVVEHILGPAEVVGPFDTDTLADEWVREHRSLHAWRVVKLQNPKAYQE